MDIVLPLFHYDFTMAMDHIAVMWEGNKCHSLDENKSYIKITFCKLPNYDKISSFQL